MDKLIRDRQLFPQLIHAGLGANIVVTLIQSGMTDWVILIGMLAPFPVVYLLFSNKYYKQLKFKDETSNIPEGKIFGKNLLIYSTLLVSLITLISIVCILQERFFTFNYQNIFILIVNIIYFGALFLLFLKKVDQCPSLGFRNFRNCGKVPTTAAKGIKDEMRLLLQSLNKK